MWFQTFYEKYLLYQLKIFDFFERLTLQNGRGKQSKKILYGENLWAKVNFAGTSVERVK
jgi:hypothetical protein